MTQNVATGEGVTMLDGVEMYRIPSVDRIGPFLMSIVSASDLWMYISSRGGLTCGRQNEDRALFPYVTDDHLHTAHSHTGPLTVLRIRRPGDAWRIWRPFDWSAPDDSVQRNLYKAVTANQLVFETVTPHLGLAVRQRWTAASEFGVIRTVTILNHGDTRLEIGLVDGIRDLMPGGSSQGVQDFAGCLVNAYTRADVDAQTGLAAVCLSAQITDKATPVEVLEATTVWCTGLPAFDVLLSTDQVESFCRGNALVAEQLLTGRRAGYFVTANVQVEHEQQLQWHIVADVARSHVQVEALRERLCRKADLKTALDRAVAEETDALVRLVASADGLQQSQDHTTTSHHYANVLFNIMRGGVFAQNNQVDAEDLVHFVEQRNRPVAARHASSLAALRLRKILDKTALLEWASQQESPDLLRLAYEYLPLTFSRRHGDPSRPWNRFSIQVRREDGSRALAYQGNWRDIFQNWEALLVSYPEFIESVIAKFINASTVDGFNPYRVSHEGIDWEIPEPHSPWANIGYWGDHQIVYLTRLLELSDRLNPGALSKMLGSRCFSYADVPYRLRPYDQIVADPRNTIDFDHAAQEEVVTRTRAIGADGKLLDAGGVVHHVTFGEKLLVPILCKLSNLVPDGGVWMNAQRPEWNDANNALVGPGISMVTACQLRRHLVFCRALFTRAGQRKFAISMSVKDWFASILGTLTAERACLHSSAVSSTDTRRILDALGQAFSDYRKRVFTEGLGACVEMDVQDALSLFAIGLEYLDHAIAANRRPDGLYHAYNLLDLSQAGHAHVGHLYEMLEGQVAVLSSGYLKPQQAIELLEALYRSSMYRPDQLSFMLYPDRKRPTFFQKNTIPAEAAVAAPLLNELVAAGDTRLVSRDIAGQLRFNKDVVSFERINGVLDRLASEPRWREAVTRDRAAVLKIFSDVFDVRQFTGRSGTMFGYEGLGCIYWHMVTKLLLAIQECTLRAAEDGADVPVTRRLADLYFKVRSGLGFCKDAGSYGAFPADPYSHTPAHAGAQQPGMTGQVKEEILARWGELGITFLGGQIRFHPRLLRKSEFTARPTSWRYLDLKGQWQVIDLPARCLAFTLQGQPVVYQLSEVAVENRYESHPFKTRQMPQPPLIVPVYAGDLLGA